MIRNNPGIYIEMHSLIRFLLYQLLLFLILFFFFAKVSVWILFHSKLSVFVACWDEGGFK